MGAIGEDGAVTMWACDGWGLVEGCFAAWDARWVGALWSEGGWSAPSAGCARGRGGSSRLQVLLVAGVGGERSGRRNGSCWGGGFSCERDVRL